MYNNKEIASLSREELSKALQSFHLKSGPITNTTRRIFENRLKQHLESSGILTPQVKEEKENSPFAVGNNKCLIDSNGECLTTSTSEANLTTFNRALVDENPHLLVNGFGKSSPKPTYNDEKYIKNISEKNNPDISEQNTRENKENTYLTTANMCHNVPNPVGGGGEGEQETKPKSDYIVKVQCDNHRRRDVMVVASCNGTDTTLVGKGQFLLTRSVNHPLETKTEEPPCPVSSVPASSSSSSSYSLIKSDHTGPSVNTDNNSRKIIIQTSTSICNNDTPSANELKSVQTEKSSSDEEQQPENKEDVSKSTTTTTTAPVVRSYYAVWVPYSPLRVGNNAPIICESQQEALTKMKAYKGSRFKVFDNKEDAENFCLSKTNPSSENKSSLAAAPSNATTSTVSGGSTTGDRSHSSVSTGNATTGNATTTNTTAATTTSTSTTSTEGEKHKVVKVPSFHDTIKFRQHIEKFNNKLTDIENCLCNPRYLISSSDIPVILQEGSRMNAVHIAIKCNRLKVLKLIFNYLQSDDFLRLIYPSASVQQLKFRQKHLLDLYLNTPEKILCDTPLHMACKFGCINIVKFLLGFDLLKVEAQNSERKTGKEVICDRVHAKSVADREKVKNDMLSLFEQKAYIPLYDNEDAMQSKIGEPILTLSPNAIYSAKTKVKAYAGPMSPNQATRIFREWKRSPRHRIHSIVALSDFEKGMERVGRSIAMNENVPFTEYWTFLDKYANFRTTEGLKKLEKYLKSKYTASIQTDENEDTTTSSNSTSKVVANGSSSSSSKKKHKNGRRGFDTPGDKDKKPGDIKRKLSFDEVRMAYSNLNEKALSKNENNKKTGKTKKLSDPHPTRVTDVIDKIGGLDLVSSPLRNNKNWPEKKEGKVAMVNGSPQEDEVFTNELKKGGLENTTKNVTLLKRGVAVDEDGANSSECGCLAEAFTNLSLKSPENGDFVEEHGGNIDMDLVNQSVSFHLEPTPERGGVDSNPYSNVVVNGVFEHSSSDPFESSSTSNNNSSSPTTTETHASCNGDSLLASPPCGEHSPSSYNSPVPSQQLLDNSNNKMAAIPGIINLSGKTLDASNLPGSNVYINGNQPSKHDLDVFRALDTSGDLASFPHIRRWKCLIESFSEDTKTSWPSPGSPRYLKSKSKRRTSWTA